MNIWVWALTMNIVISRLYQTGGKYLSASLDNWIKSKIKEYFNFCEHITRYSCQLNIDIYISRTFIIDRWKLCEWFKVKECVFEFWIHECNIYMYKCTAVDLFCPPRSHFLFVENKYPGIALQLQRSRGIPSTPATYLLELEKKRVLRLTHSKSRYEIGMPMQIS